MGWLDLHMHSWISNDGEFSPRKLMEYCYEAGVRTAALTDHNSVRGVEEALFYGQRIGIQLITAVELDCKFKGTDLHVLGYGIDITNSAFGKVEESVENQERQASEKLMELVKEMGIIFNCDEVMQLSRNGIVTGEMIAEAALRDERNRNNPLMAQYYPGGARSDNPYVNFYWDFCSAGKGAYVPMNFMSLTEAIGLICSAGGIPVLAHPGNNVKENEELLHGIIGEGIKGLEVYSSYHSPGQTIFYAGKAQEYGLIGTLGSDFHGKTKPAIKLGGIDCHNTEKEIYRALMEAI